MASSFSDLIVRVGVDGIPAFKNAFKDAIEALENTGDRANRAGAAINRAFANLGVGDASSKVALEAKKLQSSFELLEKSFKDGKITAADFAKAQEGLAASLRKLGDTAEPVAAKVARINEAFKSVGVVKSDFQITTQVQKLKTDLSALEAEYKKGEISAKDFALAQKSVAAEIDKLTKLPVKSFTDQMKDLGNIGDSLRNVGGVLTATITAPLTGAAVVVTKFAKDFELAMRQVTSLLGRDAADSFKPLSDGALELSKRLGIDAVGAAKALYEAISAGVPKENALSFLEVASKAAIAGVTETKVAVDGMTNIINAYGLSFGKAKEVSDAMFQAVNIGKFSFEQLAASVGIAAGSASQLGVDFRELLAAAATITKQGFSVSEAFTQIQSSFTALIKPTKEMEGLFAKIGVSSGEALIKSKGLGGALQAVSDAAQGNIGVLSEAFGRIEGLKATLALTGKNARIAAEDFDSLKKATEGVGASQLALDEINKSFSRQLDAFIAQAKVLAIEFGTAFLPVAKSGLEALKPLLGILGDLSKAFQELPTPVQVAIGGVTAFAAALGPLLLVGGSAVSTFAQLAVSIKTLGGLGAVASSLSSLAAPLQAITGLAAGASVAVAGLFGAAVIASIAQTVGAINDLKASYKDLARERERAITGKQDIITGFEESGKSLSSFIPQDSAPASKPNKPAIDLKGIAAELNLFSQAAGSDLPKAAATATEAHAKLAKAAKQTAADHKLAKNAIKEFQDGIPVAIIKEYEAKLKSLKTSIARYTVEQGIAKAQGRDWDGQLDNNIESSQALADSLRVSSAKHFPEYVAGLGNIKDAARGLTTDLKAAIGQFGDLDKAFRTIGLRERDLASVEELKNAYELIAANVGKIYNGRPVTQAQADRAEVKYLEAQIANQRELNGEVQKYQERLTNLKAAINAVQSADDAYRVAGLATLTEIRAAADRAAVAYQVIATTGQDGIVRVLEAQGKALASQRELAIATGQSWDELDDQLGRVADRLKRATDLKGVSDLQAAFRNFANDAGKAVSAGFAAAFDGLISGDFKRVGDAFKSMWKGVAAAAVKDFTDPLKNALSEFFGKTVRDLLKGSLSGVKEDLKDIASVIKGLFGVGSTAASAGGVIKTSSGAAGAVGGVASAGGGAASTAGSAGSVASSGATAIVGAVAGVASAISGVVSNFQFAGMNKSLDIIVKHTLQTANDLANLRADEWLRETHLFTKLDDLAQFTWTKLDDIVTAVRGISITGSTSGAPGEGLNFEPLLSAIREAAASVVAAIGGLGTTTTAAATVTQTVVLRNAEEMSQYLAKLVQDQAAALSSLPPEIQTAINAGKLAELVSGQDQATKDAIAGYIKITSELEQVREAINSLKPAAAAAASPSASPFDPSQARAIIAPSQSGFDITSYLGAISNLGDRMAVYWERLFEVLAAGATETAKVADATTAAGSAVAEATKSASAAVVESTTQTTEAVGFTTQAVDRVAEKTQAVAEVAAAGFTRLPEKFSEVVAEAVGAPAGFTASAYVKPDYSSAYANTTGLPTLSPSIGPSAALTNSLLPTAPALYPANSAEWKAAQADWLNAPNVDNWRAPAAPVTGTIYVPAAQLPIQVTMPDGRVLAAVVAEWHEREGYR